MISKLFKFFCVFTVMMALSIVQPAGADTEASATSSGTVTGQEDNWSFDGGHHHGKEKKRSSDGAPLKPGDCRRIADRKLQSKCWAEVAETRNDAAYCAEATDKTQRTKCVERVASKTMNIAVCDRLSTAQERQKCYARLADKKDDLSMCDQRITDPRIKKACQEEILEDKFRRRRKDKDHDHNHRHRHKWDDDDHDE